MNNNRKWNWVLLSLATMLSSCVGTNENNTTSNETLAESRYSTATNSNAMKVYDQFKLDTAQPATCYEHGQVCISYSSDFGASYRIGGDKQNHWVSPLQPAYLKIKFESSPVRDFHLADIYNELNSNPAVGKINGIDTSDCDSLIAGSKSGSICKIYFMYKGLEQTQQTNNIHFIFKYQESTIDYPITVQNHLSRSANIVPIVEFNSNQDPLLIKIPTAENNNQNGLTYNNYIGNQVQLINSGTVDLLAHTLEDDDNRFLTMSVQLGSFFDSFMHNDSIYYGFANETSCGSNPLLSMGENNCLFPFYFYGDDVSKQKNSYGVFNVIYYPDGDSSPENLGQNFVISQGDLSLSNWAYSLPVKSDTHSLEVTVNRNNTGNAYLVYSNPLKNVKFYARFDPRLDLSSEIINGRLSYSYGDYSSVPLDKLLAQITISVEDNSCFTSGFDISTESSADLLTPRTCKLKLEGVPHLIDKPLGFQLYASYSSETDNGSQLEQLLGNIILTPTSKPGGDYVSYFNNITWSNGVLSGVDRDSNETRTLNYEATCALNSRVGVFSTLHLLPLLEGDVKVINNYLYCDTLNENFPPSVNYHSQCTDLKYGNGILSGYCAASTDPQKVFYSSLDYQNICKNGDKVMVNDKYELQCVD